MLYLKKVTENLFRDDRNTCSAKYKEALNNLIMDEKDMRIGWRFTFQQNNNSYSQTHCGWFRAKHFHMFEWLGQNPNLNQI